MMPGIGHNSGRVSEPGQGWRRFAWSRARADLLPKLPVEVVRLRVKRAAELGLPYKTYAGVRASTGHDLIGFLFSSNALGVLRPGDALPAKLDDLQRCQRVALAQTATLLTDLQQRDAIDAAHAAPSAWQSWRSTRERLQVVLRAQGAPGDRYLLIGDTALERDWAEAARLAGYLPAATFFGAMA